MLVEVVRAVPDPQAVDGVQEIVPFDPPTVTFTLLVPCPEVIVHPAGKAHV
jgi:hypothetical protein